MLRQQHQLFRNLLVAIDVLIIVAATIIAYHLRFGLLFDLIPPEVTAPRYDLLAIPFLVAAPTMLLAMAWAGLYRPRRDQRFFSEAWAILRAVLVGVISTIAFLSLFQYVLFDGREYSGWQYLLYAGVVFTLLICWRFGFRIMLRWLRGRGWNLRHVAIIGVGRLGQAVYNTLDNNSWTGIKPNFFISHHRQTNRKECLGRDVRGGLDDLEEILDSLDLSGIFIAVPGRMVADVAPLIQRLERFALDVRVIPDMNPKFMPMNMAVHELDGMPILSVRQSPLNGWGRFAKRSLDIIGSVTALLIFGVPMLIIAALIRLTSPGPAFFRQQRISLNGRRFRMYKFRTMQHIDPDEQATLNRDRGTAAWTKRNDPRITPLGRLLRKLSLDEIPQLINVLLGHMSLVGPRPEMAELIERHREDWRGYMLRQNVKAGITGWAQVNGLRGDTSLRKRLQYDLFYIRNWSIGFDLRILLLTLFKGFAHPNAH